MIFVQVPDMWNLKTVRAATTHTATYIQKCERPLSHFTDPLAGKLLIKMDNRAAFRLKYVGSRIVEHTLCVGMKRYSTWYIVAAGTELDEGHLASFRDPADATIFLELVLGDGDYSTSGVIEDLLKDPSDQRSSS